MPGIVPFIPLIAGALGAGASAISSNDQNKANQKNATNAAASAQSGDKQALAAALARLQQYTQSNPSPTANAAPIQGPASTYGQSGATVGGGTVGGANGGTVTPPPAAQAQQSAAAAPAAQGQGAVNVNSGTAAQLNPVMMQQILAAIKSQQGAPTSNMGDVYKNFNGGIQPIKRNVTLGGAL